MSGAKQHRAFVDEYGDPNINTDKPGASTYFIVAAIILDDTTVGVCREQVSEVRRKHFGHGALKSKNVGGDWGRRIEILKALNPIGWKFCSLAVDKREVYKNSGLIYKTSFRKYLNNRLYQRLFGTFPHISITADNVGKPEFMEGFVKYVNETHTQQNDLFEQRFQFTNSEGEILIQLADFVAGSLARIFDPTKVGHASDEILRLLLPHSLGIEQWPFKRRIYSTANPVHSDQYDNMIREQGELSALQFLEKFSDEDDPNIQLQVETISQLLFHFYNVDSTAFIFGERLLQLVKDASNTPDLTLHSFRTQAIARLRDAGVILASSPSGYKIPSSYKDLYSFVERGHAVIDPMLSRIKRARDRIFLATQGKVDILDEARFANLKQILGDPGG